MKTVIIFLASLLVAVGAAFGQAGFKPATQAQQQEMVRRITESSQQLKTLRCDFVQRKTISILSDEMVSDGRMYFKQPDKLRWEYTKPYQYQFVLNGDKVMINSGTTKNVIDVSSSKIFREISRIIVSGINGSGIFDRTKFDARFLVGAKNDMVALTPKQKEIKQMFNEIHISFDRADYSVDSVEIVELNGDKTLIEMRNKQINKELDDEIFVIR